MGRGRWRGADDRGRGACDTRQHRPGRTNRDQSGLHDPGSPRDLGDRRHGESPRRRRHAIARSGDGGDPASTPCSEGHPGRAAGGIDSISLPRQGCACRDWTRQGRLPGEGARSLRPPRLLHVSRRSSVLPERAPGQPTGRDQGVDRRAVRCAGEPGDRGPAAPRRQRSKRQRPRGNCSKTAVVRDDRQCLSHRGRRRRRRPMPSPRRPSSSESRAGARL